MLEHSPLALTAKVAASPLGRLAIEGVVFVGVIAGAVYLTRTMINKSLGRDVI